MHPALTMALLLGLSTAPALLPRRKHAVMGVLLVLGLWIAGGAYLLHDLGQHPSGGDGPAFFAIAFLVGLGKGVALLSLAGRALAEGLAARIAAGHGQRVFAWLLGIAVVPVALVVLAKYHAIPMGLAAIVGFPLLWMGVAMALLLRHGSKQKALRGAPSSRFSARRRLTPP